MNRFISLAVLVLFLLALQSCTFQQSTAPELLFSQGESACISEGEQNQANVSVGDGQIFIVGAITTNTPCYHLVPLLHCSNQELLLTIHTVPEPNSCVQCLGIVRYSSVLTNLVSSVYQVQVVHDDILIESYEVNLANL